MLSKIRIDGVWHDVADGKWETLLGDKIRENAELQSRLATKDVQIAEMREASTKLLKAVDDLISESDGVCGLHLNGDAAPWGSLVAGGMFEEWLLPLEEARAVLAKYPEKEGE